MKIIIQLFFILLVSYPNLLIGQQIPIFSQYRNQLASLNPAGIPVDYIRENFNTSIRLSHRNQWLGVEGQPITYLLSAKKIFSKQRLIMGGYILTDKAGAISHTIENFNLGYLIINQRRHKLSGGISVGGIQYKIDLNKIKSRNNIDETRNSSNINAGAGIFYVYRNKIYASLAVPHLWPTKEEIGKIDARTHSFFSIGGYFPLRGETTFWEPSLLIRKIEGIPFNVDANVRLKFIDACWIGGGFGISMEKLFQEGLLKPFKTRNFHLETGFILGRSNLMKIGFSYDGILGDNLNNVGSTFEVNLSYSFDW